MAENATPRAAEGEAGEAAEHVLLVVIASDPTATDDLFTALLDIGVTGATVVESKGMAAVLREEMPIFAGLVALAPGATGSRMLFSATSSEAAQRVLDYIKNEERSESRSIALVIPIQGVAGLTR